MKGLGQPSKRDYQSVLNFMENNGGQFFEEESEFIYHKNDLVTLRPGREYAWLDGTIERILQTFRCKILAVGLDSLPCELAHPDNLKYRKFLLPR